MRLGHIQVFAIDCSARVSARCQARALKQSEVPDFQTDNIQNSIEEVF